MAEPKDTSFFRKVVRFVANPATDWSDLATPTPEARESEFAKSELKAMIERKRRNDFVRKREFDMLRKVRREGLTGEQLAALGGSSNLDDSEVRMQESGAKQDIGVKAKIDEIEQQMVGDGYGGARRTGFHATGAAALQPAARRSGQMPLDMTPPAPSARSAAPTAAVMNSGVSPLSGAAPLSLDAALPGVMLPFPVDVSEAAHDPELDEAVIAFANADFDACEQALTALTRPGGARARHAETWLVLFDLYRATGQQPKFESLALDYAQQFGWSSPQWFSLPKLVADAASEDRPKTRGIDGQVSWVAPEWIDAPSVATLRSTSLQSPLPWVFDWSELKGIDAEASAQLSELFRHWMTQKLDMRWLAGDRLGTVLAEAAPVGNRDADPAYWRLRLDVLRMANRPDQFDETAIDYCVTYEVSPPSWEPAECQVRVSGSGRHSTAAPTSQVSEVSTTFLESQLTEDAALVQGANVELAGQLLGDIGDTLRGLGQQLGAAVVVNVSCARLIRVDFIAAGDLLNWVLARRSENRQVNFIEAHRLVALFFGAMGITENARVKVRTV